MHYEIDTDCPLCGKKTTPGRAEAAADPAEAQRNAYLCWCVQLLSSANKHYDDGDDITGVLPVLQELFLFYIDSGEDLPDCRFYRFEVLFERRRLNQRFAAPGTEAFVLYPSEVCYQLIAAARAINPKITKIESIVQPIRIHHRSFSAVVDGGAAGEASGSPPNDNTGEGTGIRG